MSIILPPCKLSFLIWFGSHGCRRTGHCTFSITIVMQSAPCSCRNSSGGLAIADSDILSPSTKVQTHSAFICATSLHSTTFDSSFGDFLKVRTSFLFPRNIVHLYNFKPHFNLIFLTILLKNTSCGHLWKRYHQPNTVDILVGYTWPRGLSCVHTPGIWI